MENQNQNQNHGVPAELLIVQYQEMIHQLTVENIGLKALLKYSQLQRESESQSE
ncbi:hypothetical protein [Bacillus paranthracis]|uniref:hypothetical protein n=1 Tax=Bacillus paranthracis TaxID=2026186 RepID=UPI002D774C46|nr:hypothetical protein [Bacillus paranthracis]